MAKTRAKRVWATDCGIVLRDGRVLTEDQYWERNARLHRLRYERKVLTEAGIDYRAVGWRERGREVERAKQIIAARQAAHKAARIVACKRLHGLRLRQAMPSWADRDAIAAIYAEAQRLTEATGEPHEVDHIVPLLGREVSGLHVDYNLRVVHRTVNRRKSNRI